MCDEFTARMVDGLLARRGLTRRQFAALGSVAALAACGAEAIGGDLRERTVRITTRDGIADGFFVHPAQGAHPAVIIWPDVAGFREAFRIMARNLAASGHAVLVVNPYYRSAPAPVLESFSQYLEEEGRQRVSGFRELLTPAAISRDAGALVAFLDGEEVVDSKRGIGVHGYCMGGPFALRSAAAAPGRITAAASFHGGGLVTEGADSPHRLIGKSRASLLIAIARNDDASSPDHKDILRKAAEAGGRPAEIEVYPADHGWCVPDAPAWDPSSADRAEKRLLALYSGL